MGFSVSTFDVDETTSEGESTAPNNERLRLYIGSTELNYNSARIVQSNDHLIDQGKARIEANSSVSSASVIDFRLSDGLTSIFTPKVWNIKEDDLWELLLLSKGWELNNIRVQTVYTNTAPEDIVQDIIDNRTQDLTYASSTTSGVTINYIADGYLIDALKDMIEVLQWQTRIDENDNFYFEPKGTITNGRVLVNGTDCQIQDWETDPEKIINHARVEGGFENFETEETVNGTGTTFTLTYKPSGNVRATVSGSEVNPDNYTVNAEDKEIVFNSSQTDPTFRYSYNRPIIVEYQDDNSINTYGEIYQKVPAPWLDTSADARRYAKSFVNIFKDPLIKAKLLIPRIDFTLSVGEEITVTDNVRGKSESFIISKITHIAEKSSTMIDCGSRDFVIGDWQRKIEERIKKVERRFKNDDRRIFSRYFNNKLQVGLALTVDFEKATVNNQFYNNHKTLSRMRTVVNGNIENYEADCSDNGNNGIWYGSGIDGNQYSSSGWRLYSGQFNGSDRYIQVADDNTLDLTNDCTIALAVKYSSLPNATEYLLQKWNGTDGYAIRTTSNNEIEFLYENGGTVETFKTTSSLSAGSWMHVVFRKDGTNLSVYVNGAQDNTNTASNSTIGTNSTALQVGRYDRTYCSGEIDEVRIYDTFISIAEAVNINDKFQVSDNLKLYLAMDNPKLGDHIGSRSSV